MHTRTLIVASIAAAGLIAPATAQGVDALSPPRPADVATAAPAWAPESSATIHPGAQTSSPSGSCTANFVFYTSTDIFLGSAAHCTTTAEITSTANGCEESSRPLGTKVTVQGASQPAELVYNSWRTMQAAGETNSNICSFNDFALLKLNSADHNKVNPTVPFWGGPDGVGTSTPLGSDVYANGNSILRLGIAVLQPKVGISLGDVASGWAHRAYFATPGIPGDSGGAVMNSSGNAVGVFSTVILAPYTGANDASDLAKAIAYMKAKTNAHDGVVMAEGTRGFQPIL